jgi:hypothetical protein
LKRRVRDVVEPGRDLGHVDRDHKREGGASKEKEKEAAAVVAGDGSSGKRAGKDCEDCQ